MARRFNRDRFTWLAYYPGQFWISCILEDWFRSRGIGWTVPDWSGCGWSLPDLTFAWYGRG